MKKKLMTLLMSAVMALGISASAFAAPVGVVNVNAILNSYPGITEIAKSVAQAPSFSVQIQPAAC